MPANDQVFVLYDDVTRQHFQDAARTLGLEQHPAPPHLDDGVHEEVWATPDQRSAVNYLEDPILGLSYIVMRGDPHGRLTHAMASRIQIFSPEEAIEFAVQEVDTRPQVEAIYRLAAMFPEHDPQVMEIFRAYATKSGDPTVREATVNAVGYWRWPELESLLEDVLRLDDNAGVKERARAVLALYPAR
jgi:hypothetical protein